MKLSLIGENFGVGSDSELPRAISRLTYRMEGDELKGLYKVFRQDLPPGFS